MITAMILAGGHGIRMKQELPKQFIEVEGKPVLVHTLENFQNHPLIDNILVVTLHGWQETVWSYKEQYGISKLQWVTEGGNTTQESIRNGVYYLKNYLQDNDIVIVHDGIRPLLDIRVLNDVIETCQQYGNAVTAMPYNEQIFITEDNKTTTQYIPRERIRRVSTPQAYRYDLILLKYQEAYAREIGIYGSSYTNTMMVDLGVTLYFSEGSDRNIKLTTPEDMELYKAYLAVEKAREGNQS